MNEARRDVLPLRGVNDWAEAIASLTVDLFLTCRTVFVPTEAHAHSLRLALLDSHPRAVPGTRFVTPDAAARAVLEYAGVSFRAGEDTRRALRLRYLARRGDLLEFGDASLDTAGWGEAFAASIEQLEAGGLRPDDLDALRDAQATKLATVWRLLDASAGASWTAAQVAIEAARLLECSATAWPFPGPTLALVSPGETAADARFIRAIPRVTFAVATARPSGTIVVDRLRRYFGDAVADALDTSQTVRPGTDPSELAILQTYLFVSPHELAAPNRPRSTGPDGTVSLESHAGSDDELEAAAYWVAEQVHLHGTRLQDIAVLVPAADLAPRVADRISELPWESCPPPDGSETERTSPCYLATGRPLVTTASGSRLLALVEAIAALLPADAMVALLVRFRRAGDERPLSPRHARAVVTTLGIAHGEVTDRATALRWRRRLPELEAKDRTRGLTVALDKLLELADAVLAGASIASLWKPLRAFIDDHLIAANRLRDGLEAIDLDIRGLASDPICSDVVGVDAMRLIGDRVRAASVVEGRFGDPAVFVGTVAEAAGLSFAAVRVLGLAEALYPGTLRQDPLLVPELRGRLPTDSVITSEGFTASRLQLLHRVVLGCRVRLVISVPRDVAGGEREPAAVVQDIAAALGRPNAVTGASGRTIPTGDDLERDAFRPARTAAQTRRHEHALTAPSWHDRVAADRFELPSDWDHEALSRIVKPDETDDVIGGPPLPHVIPGLTPGSPIAAGSLQTLLQCPRKFLLQRVLVNLPRQEPASEHQVDAMPYGSLLHSVVDRFAREHGPGFGQRSGSLPVWLGLGADLASDELSRYCDHQPLHGLVATDATRRKLARDTATFLTDDWGDGTRRDFVASELPFEGVVIETEQGPLHVHGRIDRIDQQAGRTLVRDLKSGAAHPRVGADAGAQLHLDLQLALYAEVVSQLAPTLGIPSDIEVAYAYVDPRSASRERSFRDDMSALRSAGATWLGVAAGLLREQVFAATPDVADCRYCEFAPVCGTGRGGRAPAAASDTPAARILERYRALKS